MNRKKIIALSVISILLFSGLLVAQAGAYRGQRVNTRGWQQSQIALKSAFMHGSAQGAPSNFGLFKVKCLLGSQIDLSNYQILISLLIQTGLIDALLQLKTWTLFAPTDEAFEALPEGTLEFLAANPDLLVQVLLFHVVGDTVLSTDLFDGLTVETLQGSDVVISINDRGVFVNDAQVILVDVQCGNRVVHGIDAVLIPPIF